MRLRGSEGVILFKNDSGPFFRNNNSVMVFIIRKIEIDNIASFNANGRRYPARAVKDNIGEIGSVGILAEIIIADVPISF